MLIFLLPKTLKRAKNYLSGNRLLSVVFQFFLMALILFYHSTCLADSASDKQPLSSYRYKVSVPTDKELQSLLRQELSQQRETNFYLQHLSAPLRVTRYQKEILTERLFSEGYYDAEITTELDGRNLTYTVAPGNAYQIKHVELVLPHNIEVPLDEIGLLPKQILRAEDVLEAKARLHRYIEKHHCLHRIDTQYQVVLETSTNLAEVTLSVADSPEVVFGDIHLNGLASVDSDYLKEQLPIKQGQCFKPSLIESARLSLIQTNLLSRTNATTGDPHDSQVDVTFDLHERHHKTIGAGIGFQSDNGLGLTANWEHRNLLSQAELLRLELLLAQQFQRASGSFRKPHFLRDDQSLTLFSDLERERTDAFDSQSLEAGAEISRQFGNYLQGNIGAELTFSRVEENNNSDNFALASIPLSFEYDRRNDPLDPTSGWASAVQLRPYLDAFSSGRQFLRSSIAVSGYYTQQHLKLRPTYAVRFATGLINGEDRDDIPANLRFFSGGGGSVRGYAFQSLGPFEDEDPAGGLSFTEISFESRLRIGANWGAAFFLDGGFAFTEQTPSADENILWGAGLGVRYYTNFAPIRFDIAAPLQPRGGVDDPFQIYISIGQSF